MKINFKDFINESKEDDYIPNKLPDYLYHLTLAKNYDNIKENGLDPKFSKQSKGGDCIYLADEKDVAENYAGFYEEGDELILLKISTKNLNPDEFGPDDYELQDYLDDAYEGDEFDGCRWKDIPWELSLKWTSQVKYYDIIPPENIEIEDKWIY